MKKGVLLASLFLVVFLFIVQFSSAGIFSFLFSKTQTTTTTVINVNVNNNNINNSYYEIWGYLTNPEKALYNNNFTAFYQEFKEMEALGVVKWHPEEQAIVYGRGYNLDELGCFDTLFYNNSIWCMPHYIWDSIVEYNLNGSINKFFGYRGTLYYPDGFAIDKDYLYAAGFADGSVSQKLKRYYYTNATPAPFLLNGKLTNEVICSAQTGGCPTIFSDGQFLYQTDGGVGTLGVVISRNNLQPVGQIWCNNAPAKIGGSPEGGIFSSYDSGNDTIAGICEYNLSNLNGNEQGIDITEYRKVNFTIPNPKPNEWIYFGGNYLFKDKAYILSSVEEPNLPPLCQNNKDCKEDEECLPNYPHFICKKECNTNSDCDRYIDCSHWSSGTCKGTLGQQQCNTDKDCGENIPCLSSFCDFTQLNVSGNYYPNMNYTLTVNIFNINGTFLNKAHVQYLSKKINETAWVLGLRFMFLLGVNGTNYVFRANAYINHFIVLSSNLSLVSELQNKPASPYAMLPYKAQLFEDGLLDINQWYAGDEVGNIRKPSGKLLTNSPTLQPPPQEKKDLCKGSIGGEAEGYYDTATYNGQQYKLVSFFNQIPGVNIYLMPSCSKSPCLNQPQPYLVKFINFSTIYDNVGWPGGVAVDDSVIPWKMYVNFYWAPWKNGKQLGSVRMYSVDPSNNFEWHELGEIMPSSIESLPYWPYSYDEWWIISAFGWHYGEVPWLEYPYKGNGVICLVVNEQNKERLYIGTGRQGRLIALLSPKILNQPPSNVINLTTIPNQPSPEKTSEEKTLSISQSECEQQGGMCSYSCPSGYSQVGLSCQNSQSTSTTMSTSTTTGASIFSAVLNQTNQTKTCCVLTPAPVQPPILVNNSNSTNSTVPILPPALTASAIFNIKTNVQNIFTKIIEFVKSIF